MPDIPTPPAEVIDEEP